MLWCIGGVNGNIGNIVASEGLDAFVHIGRTVVVTMEADVAEVGLHQAWLQIRDTNGCVGHIDTQSVRKGLYCCLGGTIDISIRVTS